MPLPLCVAALKSNEYAVKFRLFRLKGNCTYIGNVRRSHIYSRCKFAAGGCSEKLKCLQGARNWRKVVIHQTVSRLARWWRLENSVRFRSETENGFPAVSDRLKPKLPGADPARFLTRQRDDDTN